MSQLPLVPSLPPCQGIALIPGGKLGSCHPAGKGTVSARITRQEKIRRSNRKVRERGGGGGGKGAQLFPIFCPSSPAAAHVM